ncbi:MAG TPA: YHYH domain-containing protein [Allosphingosinicella sp.]|nr:YHYH domain-containing protein [Allosphingosinicella sp.]
MRILVLAIAAVAGAAFFAPAAASAHGGGLNREGCHNDRQRGTYHCHRASSGTRGSAPRRGRGGRRGRR